jgi:quinohemoprotein ethanol dehydrogenase
VHRISWSVVAAAWMSLGAWAVVAQQPKKVDAKALREAGKDADEWLTYNRDYAETRFSPLKQIDDKNVGRLGLEKLIDVQGYGGTRQEATPLVWNGAMYLITTRSVVFAVDLRSGKEIWRWDPKLDMPNTHTCCGVVNRGLALYDGKIYAGANDGRLAALDAATGKEVWVVQTTPREDAYTITGAPRVVKGKVIIGNSGAEYAVRGYFSAYDAETGKMAWRFYTVPGDPSKPFENPELAMAAKTWSGEWWKRGGGGTPWDSIAYDSDADILYVGTGNGGPWARDYRSAGTGDNLFLSSIIAVKPETGKMVWYYQTTPGDQWDFTAVQQLILADLRINGRERKTILQAPKNGFFYVLDRITGELISAEPYASVTWAKGVDPKTGRPIENEAARYGERGANLNPGPAGAHNWTPMSFNPATGLVYISGQDGGYTYADQQNYMFQPNVFNYGVGGRGTNPFPQAPPVGPEPRALSGAWLKAWDPIAQKERWKAPDGGWNGGGTVTTAGNLVFQTNLSNTFRAYSADKGEKLFDIAIEPGAGPPITYQLDGKQYVAVFAGQQGGAAGGRGGRGPAADSAPAAPPLAQSRIYLFALDGKLPVPQITAPGRGGRGGRGGAGAGQGGAGDAAGGGRGPQ